MQAWKRRFFSHHIGEGAKESMSLVRGHLIEAGEILMEEVPDGRERSVAMTKLEEVMFWANAGIARLSEDSSTDDESAFVHGNRSMIDPKLAHRLSKRE